MSRSNCDFLVDKLDPNKLCVFTVENLPELILKQII